VNHKAPMNEIDDNICDQLVSIFIDPLTNYSCIDPDLVDNCGLRK